MNELKEELTRPHRGHSEKKLWKLGFPTSRFRYSANGLAEDLVTGTHRMILLAKAWNHRKGQLCYLVDETATVISDSSSLSSLRLNVYQNRGGHYKLCGVDIPSLSIGSILDIKLGTTRSNNLKAVEVKVFSTPEDENVVEKVLERALGRFQEP